MANLDEFGNPKGTGYGGEGNCPEEYFRCLTEEGFNEMLLGAGMEWNEAEQIVQPIGDAEAVIDFTTKLLFLDWTTILYLALPLTLFAFYGLSIYAGFKWIQRIATRKFNFFSKFLL